MNILTVEELKDALKISEQQAKALIRTKEFPSIKIGREYRVEEQELIEWMKTTKSIKLDYSKL